MAARRLWPGTAADDAAREQHDDGQSAASDGAGVAELAGRAATAPR